MNPCDVPGHVLVRMPSPVAALRELLAGQRGTETAAVDLVPDLPGVGESEKMADGARCPLRTEAMLPGEVRPTTRCLHRRVVRCQIEHRLGAVEIRYPRPSTSGPCPERWLTRSTRRPRRHPLIGCPGMRLDGHTYRRTSPRWCRPRKVRPEGRSHAYTAPDPEATRRGGTGCLNALIGLAPASGLRLGEHLRLRRVDAVFTGRQARRHGGEIAHSKRRSSRRDGQGDRAALSTSRRLLPAWGSIGGTRYRCHLRPRSRRPPARIVVHETNYPEKVFAESIPIATQNEADGQETA